MQVPTVHINGTAKGDLLESIRATVYAIGDAIKAHEKTVPHGRDYYPQGDGAYAKAREEYDTRVKALDAVHAELTELYLAIEAQG